MIHVVCGPWIYIVHFYGQSPHTCTYQTNCAHYLEDLHSISTLQLCNRHDGAGRLDATNERHRLLLQVGQKLVQIKIQNILLNIHYIFVNKWIPIIIAWKTTTERKENGGCNAWTIKRWHLENGLSGNAKKKTKKNNRYSESFFRQLNIFQLIYCWHFSLNQPYIVKGCVKQRSVDQTIFYINDKPEQICITLFMSHSWCTDLIIRLT